MLPKSAPGIVTVTLTTPVPAASVAVICVDELTVKVVAAVDPKSTAVAPVKLAPVMVTVVPPATAPRVALGATRSGEW